MDISKFVAERKFIFALTVAIMVTIFWGIMHYGETSYKETIIGICAFYLAAQAVADWKNP